MGRVRGRIGEKAQGIRSITGRYKIDREQLRMVWGNGEAKELIYTTHGHELMVGRNAGEMGVWSRGG